MQEIKLIFTKDGEEIYSKTVNLGSDFKEVMDSLYLKFKYWMMWEGHIPPEEGFKPKSSPLLET